MANLTSDNFVDQHPEILTDRHKLTFSRETIPRDGLAFSQSGVVMLRDVIPQEALRECRETFDAFVTGLGKKDADAGMPAPPVR